MNMITTCLYLADLSSSLKFILGALSLLSIAISSSCLALTYLDHDVDGVVELLSGYGKEVTIIIIFILSFWAVIPSSSTVYMMAASQIGENVVTTPESKAIFDKLYKIIIEKLDETITSDNFSVKTTNSNEKNSK